MCAVQQLLIDYLMLYACNSFVLLGHKNGQAPNKMARVRVTTSIVIVCVQYSRKLRCLFGLESLYFKSTCDNRRQLHCNYHRCRKYSNLICVRLSFRRNDKQQITTTHRISYVVHSSLFSIIKGKWVTMTMFRFDRFSQQQQKQGIYRSS